MRKKLAVAMSGGVDSAACAYLLKEKGYDIWAFTMLIGEDISYEEDAKKICEKLAIPHYSIDLRKEFEEKVIDYLKNNARITNKKARELTGLSADGIKSLFRRMVEKNILEKHGEKRWTYYSLA